MKYTTAEVTFSEFPDEVSLCINISNCPFKCEGCHSPELQKNTGTELTKEELYKLILNNKGVSCIGFMGGNPEDINNLALYVKRTYNNKYKVGWYWGGENIPNEININNFDYIKVGPYIEEKGPLDNPNTNQKMYKVQRGITIEGYPVLTNITKKFWKNEKKKRTRF